MLSRLVIEISRGLIRSRTNRRSLMFYVVLVAIFLLFLGATVFDPWLSERPLLFLGYWAICAWLTLLAILIAIFDLLMVRAGLRKERLRLLSEHIKKTEAMDNEDAP